MRVPAALIAAIRLVTTARPGGDVAERPRVRLDVELARDDERNRFSLEFRQRTIHRLRMSQCMGQLVAQRFYSMCRLQPGAHADTPALVRTVAVRLVLEDVILDGEVEAMGTLDQPIVRAE